MQMNDEFNPNNANLYNGDTMTVNPAKEEAIERARRAKLPKLELPEGERLYIPRDKLVELYSAYFDIFNNMREGFRYAPEEAVSFGESVMFESLRSETYTMQETYRDAGEHARLVTQFKSINLEPKKVRPWFFGHLGRKRPNYPLRLIMQQAELAAETENSVYREKIANQREFLYPEEEQTAEDIKASEFFNQFVTELVPARKQKRFIKKNGEYLNTLIYDFIAIAQENASAAKRELFNRIITNFVPKRKQKRFKNQNGEYLNGLIAELMPAHAHEPEAADEPSEAPSEESSVEVEEEENKVKPLLDVPDDVDIQTVFYEQDGTDDEDALEELEDKYFGDVGEEDAPEELEEPEDTGEENKGVT